MEASEQAPGAVLGAGERRRRFSALFDAHVDEVYRYVHRRCRDHALAEDVTQDVFLSAVRSVSDPSTIDVGWLVRSARNRLVDVLRRQAVGAQKLRLIEGALAETPVLLDGRVVERIEIERALAQLSVDHRLVLALHYLDGYTVPALARELGRSVKSIEGLVSRATRQLREHLGAPDV